MQPYHASSVALFNSGLTLRRATIAVASILAMVGTSWGQTSTPKPDLNAKQVHWRKYVNKEFRFSLWYPDSYRPTRLDDVCKDNVYRRYLLCLQQRDDPDATIMVTIVIAGPFFIKTNAGGNEYTPQRIGQHLFYCGLGGSMGTRFSDECVFNLSGKTLELGFSPAEGVDSTDKANSLAFKSLRTFRTF